MAMKRHATNLAGISETSRMNLVLFGMQKRTSGPYSAAIHRIHISLVWRPGPLHVGCRSEYADRSTMFSKWSEAVARQAGPAAVVEVLEEGAGRAGSLLGLIRLVDWLSRLPGWSGRQCNFVIDSGTGTTATGDDLCVHA
jgi:hypothetical protein